MAGICVLGSFVVDLMGRAAHLPVPGETVRGNFFKMGAGGKGFNQGVAAHKAGGNVTMITKLGRDTFADVALRTMKELGMSTDYLAYSDGVDTGIALILVDENTSQNEILVVPGACGTMTDQDVMKAEPAIKEAQYLLMQLESNQEANLKAMELALRYGVKTVLNTAPYQPVEDEFLSHVDIVTPNEVEAEEMTGVRVEDFASASRAAKVFFQKGVGSVVITLGSRGVFVSSEGREEIIPAYRVEAVDTTGAGDAFNGGFVVALSEGKDIWEAARFANAVAALSVERLGTTPSMPDRSEVDEFIRRMK